MKVFSQTNYLHFVALFFLCLSNGFAQSDWQRMNPVPQENAINDFAWISNFGGNDKIIAICEQATYMISEDKGLTWQVFTNPGSATNSYDLFAVDFDDLGEGLMSGSHFSIFESIDEGQTWELSYFDPESNVNSAFNDLLKLPGGVAIAVGTNGKIMRKGGPAQDWIEMNSGIDFTLNAIGKTNSTIYAAGNGDNILLKSTDNGLSWTTQTLSASISGSMRDIRFISNSKGFITVSNSGSHMVLMTENGGTTWQIAWSGSSYFPNKIDFFDDIYGMISCGRNMYESGILLTTDGGETWNEAEIGQFSWNNERAILMTDFDEAIMAGHLGLIFRTTNFGENWQLVTNREFMGDIFSLQFTDENIGYALASNYTGGLAAHDLLKTENGGLTWETIAWNETYSEAAIHFIDNQIGFYAVRNFGLNIYKTNNGGEDWEEVESGTWDFNPMCIKFYNESLGFICGTNDIIRTQDGGSTWELVYEGVFTDDHWDIQFLSENDILISGSFLWGTNLLKSSDGGNIWENIMPESYGHGYDLEFINADTGFMACEHGMILKTTNGGENWQSTFVTASDWTPIYKIRFIDNNTGFAVAEGDYETLLKTTDQGETWNPVEMPATSGLFDVHFFNSEKGLVVGRNGLVMTTGDFYQLNPPENFQLDFGYNLPNTIFYLSWEAPDLTNTPDLVGFNIYRNDTLLDTTSPDVFEYEEELNPYIWMEIGVCYEVSAVYNNPSGESPTTEELCGIWLTEVQDYLNSDIVSCFPNPFENELIIQFSPELLETKTIQIFNQQGQLVYMQESAKSEIEVKINGDRLSSGIYFYKIITETGIVKTQKIIKL